MAQKIVDASKLDSDLTKVANAIRTASGKTGALAFPDGFVSGIQAAGGGGKIAFYKHSNPASAMSVSTNGSQVTITGLPSNTFAVWLNTKRRYYAPFGNVLGVYVVFADVIHSGMASSNMNLVTYQTGYDPSTVDDTRSTAGLSSAARVGSTIALTALSVSGGGLLYSFPTDLSEYTLRYAVLE